MNEETNEIPEYATDESVFLTNSQSVAGISDLALSLLDKAITDISYISGGIAVELINNLNVDLTRKRILWWKQRGQQLGSFGNMLPAVEIKAGTPSAYDINFSIPLMPYKAGGAYSMIVYQGEGDHVGFDLLIGVRLWYQFVDTGSLWWPNILGLLGTKGQFESKSSDELWEILKSSSHKQSMSSEVGRIKADSLCGKPGLHAYQLQVTLYT